MTLLYLDTSIFITWLQKGKKDTSEFYQGVTNLIYKIEKAEYIVIASPILATEALDHENHELDLALFDQMLTRFEIRPVDLEIAKKARDLRQKFEIETPDAIHLATAILYKAEYLCTKDKDLLSLATKIQEPKIVKLPPV